MYSKTTENLKLPLWGWEDHPDFITDLNYENRILDEAFKEHTDDYETLREQVLTTVSKLEEMEVEFGSIKEKVDQLTDLDENPIFVQLADRVTITETNIANLTGRMTNVEKELEEHETSINTLTLQMKTAKEDIEQLGTDLSDLEATVSALENTVNGHTTELTEIHSSISAIEERLDSIDTSVGSVNTSISQLINQIGSLQTAVNQNTADIKTIQDDYVKQEELGDAREEFSNAIHDQSVQDRLESDEKYATKESVEQIEVKDTEQDTAIAGLQTEQNSLDMRVEALEDESNVNRAGTRVAGYIQFFINKDEGRYILFTVYTNGMLECTWNNVPIAEGNTTLEIAEIYLSYELRKLNEIKFVGHTQRDTQAINPLSANTPNIAAFYIQTPGTSSYFTAEDFTFRIGSATASANNVTITNGAIGIILGETTINNIATPISPASARTIDELAEIYKEINDNIEKEYSNEQ